MYLCVVLAWQRKGGSSAAGVEVAASGKIAAVPTYYKEHNILRTQRGFDRAQEYIVTDLLEKDRPMAIPGPTLTPMCLVYDRRCRLSVDRGRARAPVLVTGLAGHLAVP